MTKKETTTIKAKEQLQRRYRNNIITLKGMSFIAFISLSYFFITLYRVFFGNAVWLEGVIGISLGVIGMMSLITILFVFNNISKMDSQIAGYYN